jgi:hypothetical protein
MSRQRLWRQAERRCGTGCLRLTIVSGEPSIIVGG